MPRRPLPRPTTPPVPASPAPGVAAARPRLTPVAPDAADAGAPVSPRPADAVAVPPARPASHGVPRGAVTVEVRPADETLDVAEVAVRYVEAVWDALTHALASAPAGADVATGAGVAA